MVLSLCSKSKAQGFGTRFFINIIEGIAVLGAGDFFNGLADTWDEINHYPLKKIEKMLDMLDIKDGEAVLDVGTGTGVLLPLLMRRTAAENITAIDAAEKMIEKAKGKSGAQPVHFIAADALDYPFAESSFDHIICYSVFPHFEDKRAATAQFSAALKPDGLLSVLHSSSREKINGTHTHIRSHGINSDYLLPAREYIPLLNRNGLHDEIVIDDDEMFMLCARKQKDGN